MKEVTIKVPEGVDRFTVILGDGVYSVTNEEKKMPPRWRADKNKTYYWIDNAGFVDETIECGEYWDDRYYNAGNYFKTEEAAGKVAEKIREIYRNSQAE